MNRDFASWTMVSAFVILPAGLIGWLSVKAKIRAFKMIHNDLQQAQIKLSDADRKLLFSQLFRDQPMVLSQELSSAVLSIKQPHIESLQLYMRRLKRFQWLSMAIGAAAVVSFVYLWPPSK